MTIDDAARLHLYERARSTWGAEAADTLMNAIPSDPGSLATKDDLRVLSAELRAEIHRASTSTIRTIVFAMIASNATLVGLVLAAVRLG